MNDDPLFITRKRKKWKFAHFDAWANCFNASDVNPQKTWVGYFGNKQPLIVEVGAGTADLGVGLAQKYPHDNFVAVDVKADRLYTGAKVSQELDTVNIAFVRAHASQVTDLFKSRSIKELWITFPDPFPRERQAKHRLTNPTFLRQYRNLLAKNGVVRFKTDNRELFLWSLEQFVAEGWDITELSFDLHKSKLPKDYKVTTFYERKFMAEELPINYVSIRANSKNTH